jgi:hypothetical protein
MKTFEFTFSKGRRRGSAEFSAPTFWEAFSDFMVEFGDGLEVISILTIRKDGIVRGVSERDIQTLNSVKGRM